MQDVQTTTRPARDTQRWTDAELAKLRALAPQPARQKMLEESFPGRTIAAIKLELYRVRRSMGISFHERPKSFDYNGGPTMLDPGDSGIPAKDWRDVQRPKFAESNANYLAALQSLVA